MSWRAAFVVVIVTRLGVWLAAAMALLVSVPRRNPLLAERSWHRDPFPEQSLLAHLGALGDRWDARWYLGVARDGYGESLRETAFFPLYPTFVGGLEILGVPLLLGATAVSLGAAVVTAWLLGQLVVAFGFGERVAGRAALLWCCWPAAVVLGAAYPESLAAALIAGTWLLCLRGRRWLAGVLAGLALLAKPLGLAALPFILLQPGPDTQRPWRDPRSWAAAAIFAAVAALWPLLLWWRFGNPLRFLEAQSGWGRSGSWLGPLDGLWRGARAAVRGVGDIWREPLNTTSAGVPNFGDPVGLGTQHLLNFIVVCLLAVGAVMAWRRLGRAAGASVLVALVVPLASASDDVPLMSAPRFALLAIPCFVVLAELAERRGSLAPLLLMSGVLLGVTAAGWSTWQWFA